MRPEHRRGLTVADVVLDAVPSATGLMARSVLATPWRPSPRAGLPERRVSVPGVGHDLDKVAAYNRVCGFVLRDRLPSTWLHVLSFPLQVHLMAQRDFPFGLAGLVHLSNTIEQIRPVELTQPVDLSTQASRLAPHKRGSTFDMVSQARIGESLVWRGTSTYLARSLTPPPRAQAPPSLPRLVDLPPVTSRWTLPADLGRRYAQVSGDINPIHLSSVTAKAFGFGRPIAHGMWTFARVLAALDERLWSGYRADMRFLAPILLPARVAFAHEPGFTVAVTTDDGKPYARGTIRQLEP